MLSIISFIKSYGYIAVFIGSIFEGESIILLGGLSAHETYLALPLVILFAIFGAMVGDWGFFFFGRYKKDFLIRKFPKIIKMTEKPRALVERRPEFISFAMRFMYGFRHVVPISIGMSKIPVRQFIVWNTLGAISWAFAIASIGYIAGDALERLLGNIRYYEFRIIVFAILGIAILSLIGRVFGFILQNKIDDIK
jgi:membrane protein DedA with SNARE-associated domain